jgi:deoxyribose-phosphate aldolase
VLHPELTPCEAAEAIRAGVAHAVRCVCVRPCDIELALDLCNGTETRVGAVLSFPHGTGHPHVKALEAQTYLAAGVHEIDMVANYGLIRAQDWVALHADIAAVATHTRPRGVVLKAILETSELDRAHIAEATRVAADAGVDFVKTSTGFASGGATVEAVRCMLEAAAGRVQVKASGGIRDRATAEHYLAMGCTRLGVGYRATAALLGDGEAASSTAY